MNDTTKVLSIEYVQARDFKVAAADNAVVTAFSDGRATTLQVTFARFDLTPISEQGVGEIRADGLDLSGPTKILQSYPPRRVAEFATLLRPDHALQLANALYERLKDMPQDQRQRYGIPDIRPTPKESS